MMSTVSLFFYILVIVCLYLIRCTCLRLCFFFFFKQKTAYEMRISDWSSDVCSSDLALLLPAADRHAHLDALPQPQAAPRHAADDRQQDQQPQDIVEHQPLRSNPVSARSGATTSATWMP